MTVPARVRTNGWMDCYFLLPFFVSSVNVSFRVMSTQYLEIEWTIRAKRFVARRATFLDGAYPLSTTSDRPMDGTRLWGILLENPSFSEKRVVSRGSPCPDILPPQFLHSCHAFWPGAFGAKIGTWHHFRLNIIAAFSLLSFMR